MEENSSNKAKAKDKLSELAVITSSLKIIPPPVQDVSLTSPHQKIGLTSPLQKNDSNQYQQCTPKSAYIKDYIIDDLERPWNYRIMLQLKNIGEKSIGYKWMHNEEIMHYTNVLKYITMVELILTVVHGANIFGSIVAIFSNDNRHLISAFTLAQALLFIIITIIKTWKESAEYLRRIDQHRTAFIKFGQIFTKIQNQFCLSVAKRDNDANFLDYTTEDFDDAMSSAPNIRIITIRRLINDTRNKNISKPLSLEGINEIDIVVDKGEETPPGHESKIKPENKNPEQQKINQDLEKFLKQKDEY